MKFKKFLSLLICVTMSLSAMKISAFAGLGAMEFYDSANEKIEKITDEQSISAKVKFTAPGNEATVITARYGSDGRLLDASTEKLINLTKGQAVEHTVNAIGVNGADSVKVFAVDSMGNLVSLTDSENEIRRQQLNVSASANVTAVNNVTTCDAYLGQGSVSATVKKGTEIENGVTNVVLTVTELDNTGSGIKTKENEIIIPVDVHIDGIAKGNTTPVIITIKDVVTTGMNKGNLTLYHVENGKNVQMEQVESLDNLTKHNRFHYDALTGTLTLAMATFSEVAVVADKEKAWNGTVATAFAGGSGTEVDPYLIANADQLAYLGNRISKNNDNYGNKYYKLTSDINMGGETVLKDGKLQFYPIGYEESGYMGGFSGTFDGAGHTISNIYQNTWMLVGTYDGTYYNDAMGLFGYVKGGTVKNLTVDNFSSDGEYTPTGVIAAYAVNSTFENIAITNCNPRVYNTGNGGIVGIGGNTTDTENEKLTFNNITIDNTNKISALWGSWDVACGGLMGMFRGAGHVHMTNCHVAAQIDVYNDVCGNYQYYWYRYAGMMVGTNKNMVTDKDGYTVPETTKFHAKNCTVHFGTWNDYYYCELVANSLASYTHDHQFSRLTQISSLDEIKSGDNWTKEGNFLLNKNECYHIVKQGDKLVRHSHSDAGKEAVDGVEVDKEDKTIVYLPFNQIFTGYGWGVKHIPVGEFEGVTILDREVADSVVKFAKNFDNENFLYRVGNQNTVSLESLFEAVKDQKINSSAITVTIDKVDENTNVSGTYTANASDWRKGTIKFSGTGVVKVTIQDYNFCIPTELRLEVVDAVNATSATSATANNVVLLNDCGFSSLEVSGGYTLYGNGFTMSCGSDSTALDMGYSFVTLDNGTLDNVQIVCPNFDYAVLYKSNMTENGNRSETTDRTRYYNVKSGVMASGNSQILNSRISGGRASLNVTGGNVVVDNSRIELGAVASVLVGAANNLTLRDVTLVQKPTASTYDSSKTLMGFSVLFVCDADGNAAPVTIEGELVQDAWIDENDKQYVPSAGQSIIGTVLSKTEYLHDLDGDGTKESLNLGFAYMPESLTSKVNATTITDNRTNKDDIPYDYAEVSILSGKTYVYSYKNTNGTNDNFVNVGEYVPNKYSDNIVVAYSDTAEGLTTGKSFGTDGWVYELNVDLDKLNGFALDFSKLSMSVNGISVTNFKVDGKAKPASPVAVTAGGTTYILTATLNGKEYTSCYKVTGTETSKESPSLVAANYEAGLCVASSYGGTWHGAAPALQGIQVKYWSVAEKQYKTIKLSDYTPTTKGQLNGTNTTWTYSPANGDFTLTLTGGQVHSSNNVYAMPVVCDGKLYFVAANSNGLVNTGNSARTIPVSYTFKDNNNGDILTFSHTWSVAENKDAQYKYSDFCNGTLTKLESSSGGSGGCLAEGTLITLADGTQKQVQYLEAGEELLVWNLKTGKYDTAPIVFNESDEKEEHEIIHLYFADGSDVEVIYEHGFFDVNLGKYVYIRSENAKDYIGHEFVVQGDINKNTWKTSKLSNVVIENRVTTPYSPVTFEHLCYFTDGVLSMPGGIDGMFNIFEIDANTMKYDAKKMSRDIENYGLFTYKDFEGIIPEFAYNAFNGRYLKVAIGKGLITWEDILRLAERYGIYF